MPAYLQKASNRIVVSGDPIILTMKVGANATEAEMLPGVWVILDTNTNEVKEAGAKADGVIGLIDTDPTHGIDDNYARGDPIPIIVGPNGIFVMVRALANENFIQGDPIVTAADGLSAEKATGAMGVQGDNVAVAWETWNATASAKILAKFCIVPDDKGAT